MSFSLAGATAYHTEIYVHGRLKDFNCSGSEPNLTACQFNHLGWYIYDSYAGIKCCE
jgi:hypothetical protein